MLFDFPGKENTEHTLKAGHERAKALGIDEVVVASTSGQTGLAALDIFHGFRVTVVTYHCGFKAPFQNVMAEDAKADLIRRGAVVVSATHALSGVERAVAKRHSGIYPALLIADTLKLLGQGAKVAVEISVMAADAGALTGNDVVAIGGSSRGADTALVIKPANQSDFFDLRIREIICKPRDF